MTLPSLDRLSMACSVEVEKVSGIIVAVEIGVSLETTQSEKVLCVSIAVLW